MGALMFGSKKTQLCAATVAAACALFGAQAASAATITVTSLADSGTGTLRAAAAAVQSGDTIALPAGTISLTSAVVTLTHSVTIIGMGARSTTIDGNGDNTIISTGYPLVVTGVTFENGNGHDGGAISSASTLTLTDDAFIDNTAELGGAVDAEGPGPVAEPLTIDRVLFEGNSASNAGGALAADGVGSARISDTTFSGNSAAEGGGFAILNSTPNTTATLLNDTMVANSAPAGDGALWRTYSNQTTTYQNSVFVGNGSAGLDNICDEGGGATNASLGHNVFDVSDVDCGLPASGDHTNVTTANLSALGNHAGPTDTYLPEPGSSLIGAGSATGCPLQDQRGLSRPFGSACDIGAVAIIAPLATSGAATSVTLSSATLNGTAGGDGLGTWYFQWGATTAYGNQTVSEALASLSAVPITAQLTGLQPAATIHYRVVMSDPDGTTYGSDQTFTTNAGPATAGPAPVLSGLTESARRWRVPALHGHDRGKGGTSFSFKLSEAASVTLQFERLAAGHRSGHRCVAGKPARHGIKCTAEVPFASLHPATKTGANRVVFSGRIPGHRALPAGSWLLVASAANPGGQSPTRTLRFQVLGG
jgi:predicted outer membrane repeat protein